MCEWGVDRPALWAQNYAHSWRTGADIAASWDAVLRSIDSVVGLAMHAGPGGWNDPDMLEVRSIAKHFVCDIVPDRACRYQLRLLNSGAGTLSYSRLPTASTSTLLESWPRESSDAMSKVLADFPDYSETKATARMSTTEAFHCA